MENWYAINPRPHQEFLAEMNIRNLGVETFFPLVREKRVIRRRLQDAVNPLFSGYFFARFSLDRQYPRVLYARGVKRVIAFGQCPAVVDEALIEAIRARLGEGDVLQFPTFSPGQSVRILQGALHGLEAIFQREMKGEHRAVLLLKTLSYQARVVVDLKDIVNL